MVVFRCAAAVFQLLHCYSIKSVHRLIRRHLNFFMKPRHQSMLDQASQNVKACEIHEANASRHVRLCIHEITLDSINAFCIIFLAVLQIHSFIRRPCQRSRSTYTCPKPGDATKHLVCLHLYFMFSLLKGKRFHIAITTLKYHYFASQMSASLDINTTIFLFVFAAGVV